MSEQTPPPPPQQPPPPGGGNPGYPPPPGGGNPGYPPPPPPPGSGYPPAPPGGGYGYGSGGGPAPKINNWLVPAILATLFCCLPGGIVAIVFAAQVNGKLSAGDVAGAQSSAGKAKMWTLISVGVGVAVGIIYLVGVVMAGSGNS